MNKRKLFFEPLERRVLLAGNVTAALKGGDLVVTGDGSKADANDAIEISLLESGAYRVTGLDGTTVNNQTFYETAGVTRHVKVDLKTGDNKVGILGVETAPFVVPKDLTVKTRSGGDEVRVMHASVGGKVTLDVGAGNDTVTVEDLVAAKDVSIKTGDGVDAVSLSQSTLRGKLTVDTFNGDDSVTIDPTVVEKDLSIKTGNGDDLVILQDVEVKGKLAVDTANGVDRVGLFETTVNKDATISTGNNNDVVGLKDTTIKGKLAVMSGNQQDAIGLAGVKVDGDAKLDSGNADAVPGAADSVGLTGTQIGGNLTVRTGKGADLVSAGNDPALADTMKAAFDEAFGAGLVGDILAERVGIDGSARFSTGDGVDYVGLFGVDVNGDTTVTSGKGGDNVFVGDSAARLFNLNTGNDSDSASIVNSVASAVKAIMGSGDDSLYLLFTESPTSVSLDGGANLDSLDTEGQIMGNVKLPGVVVKNWEQFA